MSPVRPTRSAMTGEFVTYVADSKTVTPNGGTPSARPTGVRSGSTSTRRPASRPERRCAIHGDVVGDRLHVAPMDVLPRHSIGAAGASPTSTRRRATDTYALVLVDLGKGVNVTTAAGADDAVRQRPDRQVVRELLQRGLVRQIPGDRRRHRAVPYTLPMQPRPRHDRHVQGHRADDHRHVQPPHLLLQPDQPLRLRRPRRRRARSSRPAKRTWMNGSLSCVVLMQEPGHNLGLMHANTIKCGTSSFSTTPGSSCTITEYGSAHVDDGRRLQAVQRLRALVHELAHRLQRRQDPATGTLQPAAPRDQLHGGTGIQVLQVPFPATLTVSDPQSTSTTVNLNNYYVELRTAGGIFDTYARRPAATVVHRPDGLHLRQRQRSPADDDGAPVGPEQRLDRAAEHVPVGNGATRG